MRRIKRRTSWRFDHGARKKFKTRPKRVMRAVLRSDPRTAREIAAAVREFEGCGGFTEPVLSFYLHGVRPIPKRHFEALCKVLRVDPDSIMVSIRLKTGRTPIL